MSSRCQEKKRDKRERKGRGHGMMLMDQRKIESGRRRRIKGDLILLIRVFVPVFRRRCDKASIVGVTISQGHSDMNSLVLRTKKLRGLCSFVSPRDT